MKIILIVFGILLGLALLGVLLYFLLRFWVKGQIVDGPGMVYEADLTYCSVTTGGGMEGGYKNFILALTEDKTGATLTMDEAESWNQPDRVQTYPITLDQLKQVSEYVRHNGMNWWASRRPSDVFALDADTTSLNFTFDDGQTFSVSEQQFPEDAWEKIGGLTKLLVSFAVNENTPRRLVTVPGEGKITILPLYVSLKAEAYQSGYLTVTAENKTGQDITLDPAYTLSRLTDGEWMPLTPTAPASAGEPREMPDLFSLTYLCDLNIYGRLEAGSYLLKMDGWQAEFTLE